MELLCIEIEGEPRAYGDPVFLDDDRVLSNLLRTEDRYILSSSYFKCFQAELKTYMRKIVSSWMLEVCEEEKCQEEIFPLAMNILDRFLSIVQISKSQLQLLGAVCLFLASKLRQTKAIPADKLVLYTDYSISCEELMGWELLVLSRLKWDLAAITPNDFVSPILRRLQSWTKGCKDMLPLIKKHAQTFIALCAADFKFSMCPPSLVAAACIGTAILGLRRRSATSQWQSQQQLLVKLNEITGIEVDWIRSCQEQIEAMIASHTPSKENESEKKASSSSPSSSSTNNSEASHPETPTDVHEVEF
ncbi:G1/S-specific cyclin-D2 [Halotydeus destructor]|nr:G1/S-specific cyclin-D2 [Halotydeus destructor]